MRFISIFIILLLINQVQGLEYLSGLWKSETPITSPQEYAQQCLHNNEFPALNQNKLDSTCPVRTAAIPSTSLVYEHDKMKESSTVILSTGKKNIKGSIEFFRLEHCLPGVSLIKQYPGAFLGAYAATYLMPVMISAPIWGAGLLGVAGYAGWIHWDEVSKTGWDFEKIRNLAGVQTTLGQALQRSGVSLSPTFRPDGLICYQGHVPNGIIPGQSLYVDLVVRPLAELN